MACNHKLKPSVTGEVSQNYTAIGRENIAPEVLQKYTPPSANRPDIQKFAALLDLQVPGSGLLHPNGKSLYYTWSVTGHSQVWRIDQPLGFPVQMTAGSDETHLLAITPDGNWLVLGRDQQGQENPGLFLQSSLGGPTKQIFRKPKVQAFLSFISDDGTWLYFIANDPLPDSYAIYRYNIKTEKTETVFNQKGLWSIHHWRSLKNSDQHLLLLARHKGSREKEYALWDEQTKSFMELLGQNETMDYNVLFAKNEGEYLVLTNKFSDYYRLYLWDKKKNFKPLSPDIQSEIEDVAIDHQFKRIFYEVNDQGRTRAKVLDASNFKPIAIPDFAGADHINFGSHDRDGRWSLISVATYNSFPRSYVYDWTKGKLQQWTIPSSPEMDLSRYTEGKLEYYTARDGVEIPMWVKRGKNCGRENNCPVVVNFHGGPESQAHPRLSIFAQALLDEGFIFVEPNVRGSSGYGKKWLDSDNGAKRLAVITDIEDCALFIRKKWAKPGVNIKVGVMGGSYGGYSTLMAMTRFAGSYDAGVANVGMSNLVTFLNNTAPYRRQLRINEYGDPVKDIEALKQLSPITWVQQIKNPLLIIQGANDPRVPVGEAIQLQNVLESKKIPSQLIIFADEGHGSSNKNNKAIEWGATLEFFKRHLLSVQ
jgi:prolyl oligopeptidase PreP (S9A serine peptidase family)